MIPNASLALGDLPTPPAGVDDLFLFAATFPGYAVWGGFEPCALAANDVHERWAMGRGLPPSVTLLRTALFFESRREQFVDYGGFGEDPEGFAEHHDYMRLLLDAIRDALDNDRNDAEDKTVAAWLESHGPDWPEPEPTDKADDGWLGLDAEPADDDKIAAACGLAARLIAVDIGDGVKIDEDRLRDRLCLALGHLSAADVIKERVVPSFGFRGAGPVDIVLRDRSTTEPVGLVEVKWSVRISRDKIYEAAWDAIKLVLADAPTAKRWLITGAPDVSWEKTETPDLFEDGAVGTVELWNRELLAAGPNGGNAVGSDCEAGGYGNMFTHAPERLRIKAVCTVPVPGAAVTIRGARIVGGEGRTIRFASPPEFPQRITDHWLAQHVPVMAGDTYDRLIQWLRIKRWSQAELQTKVYPLRK